MYWLKYKMKKISCLEVEIKSEESFQIPNPSAMYMVLVVVVALVVLVVSLYI